MQLTMTQSPCPVPTPQVTATSAPTFSLFPLLPPELRTKIWNLALPLFGAPLKVDIGFPNPGLSTNFPSYTVAGWRKLTPASRPLPPLLATCREARYIALGYYVRGFEVQRTWAFQGSSVGDSYRRRRERRVGSWWKRAWTRGVGVVRRYPRGSRNGERVVPLCPHEQELLTHNQALYWDPRQDWLQLAFCFSSACGYVAGTMCDVRGMCRSQTHHVETRFDDRIERAIMSQSVLEDFREQNHDQVLVEISGLSGDQEDLVVARLKSDGLWFGVQRKSSIGSHPKEWDIFEEEWTNLSLFPAVQVDGIRSDFWAVAAMHAQSHQ
jgi:hypothetical protein